MLFVWGVETLKFCIVNLYSWNFPLEVSLQLQSLIDSWIVCVSKKTKGGNDDNAAMQMSFWDSEITWNYFCWKGFKFIQKNVVEDYISSDLYLVKKNWK